MSTTERVITPKFRVCFPNIFSPNKENDKYGVTMVFEKGADLNSLKTLAKEKAVEKWGEDIKKDKKLQLPIKDGNEKDLQKYPVFEDTLFANAQTKFNVGLVDNNRQEILEEKEFYSGCYARASISAYAWEYKGKKGVSFNLLNVQKLDDGESLGGRVDASNEFDDGTATSTSSDDDSWGDEEI